VLAGLAPAGGERREAVRPRRDAVALAVDEYLGSHMLFGGWRAAHAAEYDAIRFILSTYYDNHYNMH